MAEKKLQFKDENEYKEFLKKTEALSSKAEFQDALKSAKTPQEALEILLKFAPDVKDYVVEVDSNSQSELSDDDLENVAGGVMIQKTLQDHLDEILKNADWTKFHMHGDPPDAPYMNVGKKDLFSFIS